jgi:hypothetical protein
MLRKTFSAAGALGALSALCAGGAHALSPTTPIDANVFVGGATAQDPGFLLITRTICQNNAIDPLNLAASDATRMDAYNGTDNQVYTCLSNANLIGVTVGTRIAIYKTSIGGSGTGVIPIARQITDYGTPVNQVRYLPVPSALPNGGNCTIGNVIGAVAVGARTAAQYLNHTACGSGNRAIVPQVGISDVEPALIDGALPSDTSALTTTAVNHGIFGYSVSEPLRNALQAAQGLVACSVARGDASRELQRNQPSLTRQQIAAVATGNVTNWNQLTVRVGAQTLGLYDYIVSQGAFGSAGNQACPFPTALAGEGGARTFVIRRVPSSGTQAITEIWTLNQRCTSGIAEILGDSDPAADTAATQPSFNPDNYVQAYSSSSGVRNGLDRASGPWAVQTGSPTEYRWAIGNLSCENTPFAAGANRAYRPVKIHGASPGLRDTATSAYDFYAEQVVNTSVAVPPPAGLPSAFATYLATNLADADVLRTVNAGFALPGTNLAGIGLVPGDWVTDQGGGCLLGVPDGVSINPPAPPITATAITTTPVNTSWKRPLGVTNNCQDPVTLGVLGYETPVGGFSATNSATEPNPQ